MRTVILTFADGHTQPLSVPDDWTPFTPIDSVHDYKGRILDQYTGLDGDTILINWSQIALAYITDREVVPPQPAPKTDSDLVPVQTLLGSSSPEPAVLDFAREIAKAHAEEQAKEPTTEKTTATTDLSATASTRSSSASAPPEPQTADQPEPPTQDT